MINVLIARELWRQLHIFAGLKKPLRAQEVFLGDWLENVEAQLDCGSCFRKVKRFLKLWPIEYGEGLWLWSVCLHDYVNKELGRALFLPHLTLAPLRTRGIIY